VEDDRQTVNAHLRRARDIVSGTIVRAARSDVGAHRNHGFWRPSAERTGGQSPQTGAIVEQTQRALSDQISLSARSVSEVVVYLLYSGLVQHAGERLCHLNRLWALDKAGLNCCAVTMEPRSVLQSPELAARIEEAKRASPRTDVIPQERHFSRVPPGLLRAVGHQRVAAVVFTQSQAAVAAWRLKRQFAAPAVWDCRGFVHERAILSRTVMQKAKDALGAFSEAIAARVADHAFCVCDAMRGELVSRLGMKRETISVLHNSTDTSRFRPDAAARQAVRSELGLGDQLVFVFSGAALPWHCLRETADFVAQVRSCRADAHLLVLSTDLPRARSEVGQSRLDPAAATLLSVSYLEVPRYLAAADCGLLLIAPTPGKDTCSPMKFSEYLAVGLPLVIGPVVGDYTRWVKEEGLGVVCDPYRPEEWPHRVQELLAAIADSGITERCRRIARERLDLASHVSLIANALRSARCRTTGGNELRSH